jgi:uncharacterized protein (TIGR02757 family)
MAYKRIGIHEEMKNFLELKFSEYNTVAFIANDPVSIPHKFSRKEDIEISGFLTSTLSWGQRATIVKNSSRLFDLMDSAPYEFITAADEGEYKRFTSFVHRTFNGEDCLFFLNALKKLYIENKDMETVFSHGYQEGGDIRSAIVYFRETMLQTPHLSRSEKHISNPRIGSAAKRINMFLRWMVRDDENGVDFGIWKSIPVARLMCPLDVHSGRVARNLGLLKRKQDDWKAVEELTANLRTFDPSDPVKYDYSLFGLGVSEKLRHGNK